MSSNAPPTRWQVVLAFACVYIFWGSTYLGIRVAIEHITPALMSGSRFLTAGMFMLAYCVLTGRRIWHSSGDFVRTTIVSILLLMGGNLTLCYVERVVPTGLSALLVSTTPLWLLVLDSMLLGDHHIEPLGKAGLFLGVLGVAVLIWPELVHPSSFGRREFWWSLALPGASLSWALGSVLSKKWKSPAIDPFTATAWQVMIAGVLNLGLAFAAENTSQVVWTARGIGAVLYLVVFGSLIGYTAYIWLLQHVPTSKVSTYAYVNPVVAVFLGWLILHERIDRYILMGSAIIVASVVLVTSAKIHTRPAEQELPAVEAAGD